MSLRCKLGGFEVLQWVRDWRRPWIRAEVDVEHLSGGGRRRRRVDSVRVARRRCLGCGFGNDLAAGLVGPARARHHIATLSLVLRRLLLLQLRTVADDVGVLCLLGLRSPGNPIIHTLTAAEIICAAGRSIVSC